jgi:hypothetical protein
VPGSLHPYASLLQTLVVGRLAHGHPLVLSILTILLQAEGRVLSVNRVATALGLGSRHRLARQISRAGAPPFEELTGWTQVLVWTWAWEVGHVTLAQSALAVLREPSACYRRVHRVTGMEWRVVRVRGVAWVTDELVGRLGPAAEGPQASCATPLRGGDRTSQDRAALRAAEILPPIIAQGLPAAMSLRRAHLGI